MTQARHTPQWWKPTPLADRLRAFYGNSAPVTSDESLCHEAASAIDALALALEKLVAADNCNYLAETMRYEACLSGFYP